MSKLYWSNKKTGTMAVNIPKSLHQAMGWTAGDVITLDVIGADKLKITKITPRYGANLKASGPSQGD